MSDSKTKVGTFVWSGYGKQFGADLEGITCDEYNARHNKCDSCGQTLPKGQRKNGVDPYIEGGRAFARFIYDQSPGGFQRGVLEELTRLNLD